MKMEKKDLKLVIMCGILYLISQISRSDLSACLVDLLPDLGYTKDAVSVALTAGYISYAVGMMINSTISNRTNPRVMIYVAMFVCAASHMGIRLFPQIPVIVVLWCINGYAQSVMWPSVMQLVAGNLPKEQQNRALRIVCIFQHAGSLSCYLIVSLEIAVGGWRTVMLCTAIACCTLGFVWLLARELKGAGQSAKDNITCYAKLNAKFFLSTGILAFVGLAVVCGMLREGITTWAPVYFSEHYSITAVMATLLTTLLAVAKIAAYAVNPVISKKVSDLRKFIIVNYVLCAACGLLLLAAHFLKLPIAAAILIALMLCFNGSACINFIVTLPLDFAEVGRAAFVSGFLDCMIYLGAAISSYLYAFLAEKGGWTLNVCCWILLPIISILIALLKKNMDPDLSQLEIVPANQET